MAERKSAQEALFERSLALLPGGVDSPVRAFGAVGGTPRFIVSGSGARIRDLDGAEYIDYVGAWGPAILGHAHPSVIAALKEQLGPGTGLRRAARSRDAAGGDYLPAHAVAGAHPLRQFRHRGGDERHSRSARRHWPRARAEIYRRLSRTRRRIAGRGRLRRPEARAPRQRRRAGQRDGRHAQRPLQRLRQRRRRLRGVRRRHRLRDCRNRWPATSAACRRSRGFCPICARPAAITAPC